MVIEKHYANCITYELQPGIFTFKDLSESLLKSLQSEYPGPNDVIYNELDDICMKTKLVVKSGIIAIRFNEKSFFVTFLGFWLHWDYKHCDK